MTWAYSSTDEYENRETLRNDAQQNKTSNSETIRTLLGGDSFR